MRERTTAWRLLCGCMLGVAGGSTSAAPLVEDAITLVGNTQCAHSSSPPPSCFASHHSELTCPGCPSCLAGRRCRSVRRTMVGFVPMAG